MFARVSPKIFAKAFSFTPGRTRGFLKPKGSNKRSPPRATGGSFGKGHDLFSSYKPGRAIFSAIQRPSLELFSFRD